MISYSSSFYQRNQIVFLTQDLVPKLAPTCECLCEECPPGTRICPTSEICLDLNKWCDGLQDCPDDERDCATTAFPTTVGIRTSVALNINAPVPTTPAPKSKYLPKYNIVLIKSVN